MSRSSEISGVSGEKPPEKSKFSETCSLLSQYLKKKGSFRDLTLGITCTTQTNGSPETSCLSAMNMFPNKENNMTLPNLTTMDFLSPHSTKQAPTLVKPSAFECLCKEPKSAQLTIFYGGQVIVHDDFAADKVEEIVSFATKGISQNQNTSLHAHTHPSMIHEHPHAPPSPIVSDLPIARKASLHRS